MDKSGNPALKESVLKKIGTVEKANSATISGTISKIIILFAVLSFGAYSGWRMITNNSSLAGIVIISSLVVATVLAFSTIFIPKISPYTSPIYALLEGVLLGAISNVFNQASDGIVTQALLLTGSVFATVLYLYATRLVRVTDKTRSVIIVMTVAIALYYLIALIMGLFGINAPLIYDSGLYGIIFSLIVVFVASMNLLLDFDFIERASNGRMPKFFEWYGAFSLMITVVWLYLEILRLLSKIRK